VNDSPVNGSPVNDSPVNGVGAPGGFHPLTVARVEPLTDEACAVHFTVPVELRQEYAFDPGQHLTLRRAPAGQDAGQEERRTYSICSTPQDLTEHGELRIGVKRIANGLFSGWLTGELHSGVTIEVMTPAPRSQRRTSATSAAWPRVRASPRCWRSSPRCCAANPPAGSPWCTAIAPPTT
jgi:hypothetical protein